MSRVELAENSDSSDEDYVPNEKVDDLSEAESEKDVEDDLPLDDNVSSKACKRTRRSFESRKKRFTETKQTSVNNDFKQMTEEEKKKVQDDIWADFKKETGFQSKGTTSGRVSTTEIKSVSSPKPTSYSNSKLGDVSKTVTVAEVFNFAGEDVEVVRELPQDLSNKTYLKRNATTNVEDPNKKNLKGIGGILSQLSKKPKITTLEKSKLDWDQFKKEENLQEELQIHNRGKDGYLERQDFLNRADLRRFEIEKEIRSRERNKRVNN